GERRWRTGDPTGAGAAVAVDPVAVVAGLITFHHAVSAAHGDLVARVADVVAVGVGLIGVVDIRTIVGHVWHAVEVGIRERRHDEVRATPGARGAVFGRGAESLLARAHGRQTATPVATRRVCAACGVARAGRAVASRLRLAVLVVEHLAGRPVRAGVAR